MIATANNKDINVFSVGTSPNKDQVNIPKQSVAIPKPASLIFQNAPKYSNDHLVEYQNNSAITTDKPMTNICDFKNLTSELGIFLLEK